MLSLKYVMAKSKELTSKLELGAVVGGPRSASADAPSSASSVAGSDVVGAKSMGDADASGGHETEGEAFLLAQSKDWDVVVVRHRKLLQSGEQLGDELARARKRLQDQVESEAYVTQHFHEIKHVREQIGTIRGLVEKIAGDIEDVEQFLMQQTEEYMAAQNASFVAQQERELERFEDRIMEEKEDRKRQLLAARRQVLADAFQNDLKTYQTLVAYQGPALTQRAMSPPQEESLESVDLVVTTDAAQLEAFYETEDEDDSAVVVQFTEEEEKSSDRGEDVGEEEKVSIPEEGEDHEQAEANVADAKDDKILPEAEAKPVDEASGTISEEKKEE